MDLDLRISRWILEAQRKGVRLERILIPPNTTEPAGTFRSCLFACSGRETAKRLPSRSGRTSRTRRLACSDP